MNRRSLIPVALTAGLVVVPPTHTANAASVIPDDGTTVYTLEPLNNNWANTTPNTLQGKMCGTAHPCVKVPTPASLDLTHKAGVFGESGPIFQAAQTLDQMLREDGEQDTVVFGFSQGGQIIGFWLRNYAADPEAIDYANPGNTRFLMIGDPENTYGVPWAPRVPTNTDYEVTELWAQYDGWADWPVRLDLLALANAIHGMFFVHTTAYDALDPDAENIITWTDGTMTYKMAVNENLPMLDPLRLIGFGWLADLLNAPMKAHVEGAYDRPSTQAEADALSQANAERHTAAAQDAVPAEQTAPPEERPPSALARHAAAAPVFASTNSDVAQAPFEIADESADVSARVHIPDENPARTHVDTVVEKASGSADPETHDTAGATSSSPGPDGGPGTGNTAASGGETGSEGGAGPESGGSTGNDG